VVAIKISAAVHAKAKPKAQKMIFTRLLDFMKSGNALNVLAVRIRRLKQVADELKFLSFRSR